MYRRYKNGWSKIIWNVFKWGYWRKADLINRNEDYKNLREKFNDIMNKYPNLQFILEDREMILDETECKMLQKLTKIYMGICDFEEKEIFLLGGKEMYFYLKDTGIIKEK